MTKLEYRRLIWGLLKDYGNDEIETLEELLERIMKIPFPEKAK